MTLYKQSTVMASLLIAGTFSATAVAGPYSDAVVADNPIAYYRLDETSLPSASNVGSGAGIDASYLNLGSDAGPGNIGQTGPRPGDNAGGFSIDGFEADNRSVHLLSVDPPDFPVVQLDDFESNPLDISGALTLEAWVRRDAQVDGGSNNEGIVGKYIGTDAQRSYIMYYDPNPGVVGLAFSETGAFQSEFNLRTTADIPQDEWVHLAATYEPSSRTAIYVNGQLAAEQTDGANVASSLFDSDAAFWIGKQFSDSRQTSFEGRIDEVAVYNQALSASQISAHFDAATTDTPTTFGWNVDGSGNWNDAANWTLETVPNSNQQAAVLGSGINAPRVVYTNSDVTVKGLRFANSNKYAVAGHGRMTLAADSGNATVNVTEGDHEIQTTVSLGSNTDLNGEGSLDFNNELNIGGNTFRVQSGTFNVNHSLVATAGGMIMVDEGGTLGTAGSTTFGSDLTSTGTLDVDVAGTGANEFDFFDVSGTATLSGFLDAELVDEFTLDESESLTVLTAATLVDNGIALTPSAASMFSLSVVGNSLVLEASLAPPGDYNGNGVVDAGDYVLWRDTLGSTTDLRANGDNTGGSTDVIDQADYEVWMANFGAGSASAAGTSAAVPEPAMPTLLLLAAPLWLGLRRRWFMPMRNRWMALAVLLLAWSTTSAAHAQYSAAVLGDNPIGYYRLDETTGFFAANSGTGGAVLEGTFHQLNEGTGPGNIGQPGPRPGDIAGGYVLDGFDAGNNSVHTVPTGGDPARVEVLDNATTPNPLDITGSLTLEAWVNRDAQTDGGANEGIVSKYLGADENRAYNLIYDPTPGAVGFAISPDGTFANANNLFTPRNIPLNEWVHLAATYVPGESMSLYVNGQLAATQATDVEMIADTTAELWIGQQFDASSGSTFEGRIDEAAIYDRALSAAEILEHFNAATGDTVPGFDWNVDGSGDWNLLANWSPTSVPNSNVAAVNFGNVISSPEVVFTDSEVTAKSIQFDSANSYAVAGVEDVVLEADSGNASISVSQGDHVFQAPVRLESDADVNVAAGSLSFNNVLNLNGNSLNVQSGTVTIAGQVLPGEGGTVNNSGSLSIAGPSSVAGDFTSDGELAFSLSGTGAEEFGSLVVDGTATLSGVLNPNLVDGFNLGSGQSFAVLVADTLVDNGISLSGDLAGMLDLHVEGNILVLTSAVPEPASLILLAAAAPLLFFSRRRLRLSRA